MRSIIDFRFLVITNSCLPLPISALFNDYRSNQHRICIKINMIILYQIFMKFEKAYRFNFLVSLQNDSESFREFGDFHDFSRMYANYEFWKRKDVQILENFGRNMKKRQKSVLFSQLDWQSAADFSKICYWFNPLLRFHLTQAARYYQLQRPIPSIAVFVVN